MNQPIVKSKGTNKSEAILADLCDRAFLKLWSWPNPYTDAKDGKELCDLLVVFGDHVFLFFVREKKLDISEDRNIDTQWERWKRDVIDQQIRATSGAETYIGQGRPIYLDAKKTAKLPVAINAQTAIIHKIIVALGAEDACKQNSEDNIYGSLAVTYDDDVQYNASHTIQPFFLRYQ